MKTPTPASLKRVNADNLAALGAPRLAEMLLAVADVRPELKRQLRMELAAAQGVDHLAVEVDKRLTSLETLTSKVSWRQRPVFLRDLEALRQLIGERMGALDQAAALERMWRFINTARRLERRVRDKHGELEALLARVAADLGRLVRSASDEQASADLADAITRNPGSWRTWAPLVLGGASKAVAAATLRALLGLHLPDQIYLERQLADAAGDVDAYRATYKDASIRKPNNAAEVANRLMAVGRLAEAGEVLEAAGAWAAAQGRDAKGRPTMTFEWETSTIDYLERLGQAEAAQAARWASFEVTLSVERAKAFTRRLPEFDDVEAESRAFDIAARHADFQRGLAFLMDWPAISEAGRMIEARRDEIRVTIEQAELWAPKLQRVKPHAAALLLCKAAAVAFHRHEFATCDRLTQEADAVVVPDSH